MGVMILEQKIQAHAAVAREISAITPGKRSPIFISRMSRAGNQRLICTRKTRRGGLRST